MIIPLFYLDEPIKGYSPSLRLSALHFPRPMYSNRSENLYSIFSSYNSAILSISFSYYSSAASYIS